MKRMLPGGALILFIRSCFVLKQFGTAGGPWFPTDPLVFFCLFNRGFAPYEKNVAWRGTYSFHRRLIPYEKVRFALFWINLGRTGGPWFRMFFLVFCLLYRGLTPYEKNVA
jgi:hypothetical protein